MAAGVPFKMFRLESKKIATSDLGSLFQSDARTPSGHLSIKPAKDPGAIYVDFGRGLTLAGAAPFKSHQGGDGAESLEGWLDKQFPGNSVEATRVKGLIEKSYSLIS